MAYYQIKDIGKIGVVTDLSPTDLPPNAFTDAINARFVGNQVRKFGGNKPISYNGAEDNITAFAIQPMPFDFQYDHPFNILGTKDGLYLLEDQNWENVSYYEPINSGQKTATTTVISRPLMTAINFVDNQISVKTSQSYEIYVTLTPTNVKKQDLVWTLADVGIGTLTVDPLNPLHATFTAGTVTGNSTINVSNKDGSLTNFVFLNVIPNVDKLSPNATSYDVRRNNDVNTLPIAYPLFVPDDATTDHNVTWISSDSSVFTVEKIADEAGQPKGRIRIHPGRVGSADLTVQLTNSTNVRGKARVNVLAGVTSVVLSNTALTMAANAAPVNVGVSVLPATAMDTSWHINRVTQNNVAMVTALPTTNQLTISPTKPGTEIVQVVANDGGVMSTLQITVTNPTTSKMMQDDAVGDSVVDTIDLNSILGAAPTISTFSAPVGNPPFDPKPVDGTLKITQDFEEFYRHPLSENFILELKVEGGTAPYEYYWYRDGVARPSIGTSVNSLSFSSTDPALAHEFQVVVTDAAGKQVVSQIADVYHYDPAVPQSITSLSIEPTSVDFNQGDTQKIISKVKVNDGNYDTLIYKWVIAKDGIVTHDELDEKDLTIYGLGDGSTTITLHVYPTKQKVFNVLPENNWYHTTIANCAVFNTNSFAPMIKEFAAKKFKVLPGWSQQTQVDEEGNWSVADRSWTCERVRAFNNRLFALNMTEEDEGGVSRHYPQRIRWSNFATENKAPTLWDDLADLRDPEDSNSAVGTLKALTNGYAGYIDLADTQGDLMDMIPLKDYLFVYTEFETYVGTPTMNAYQPMTFKKLYNDSGILAPGCACEVEGQHFVVTQNDIILHNGATKQSVAHSIIKDRIIEEVSSVNPAATRVYLHSDKKEVWICYVAPGMPKNTWFNSKAAVWNYEFQTWTFYEIPHTYEIVLSDPPTLDKTATWADYETNGKLSNLTWDAIAASKQPWQLNSNNFRKRITIGCSAMNGLYQLDVGSYNWAALNGTNLVKQERPLKMWVERSGIDFDNVTEEWRQKHINNFHFQVNGKGELAVEVGGTQYSNEIGHEHNYRQYIAGQTRNLSVRLNHPYLYYSIIDEDPVSTVSVSGLVIDFALGGRR